MYAGIEDATPVLGYMEQAGLFHLIRVLGQFLMEILLYIANISSEMVTYVYNLMDLLGSSDTTSSNGITGLGIINSIFGTSWSRVVVTILMIGVIVLGFWLLTHADEAGQSTNRIGRNIIAFLLILVGMPTVMIGFNSMLQTEVQGISGKYDKQTITPNKIVENHVIDWLWIAELDTSLDEDIITVSGTTEDNKEITRDDLKDLNGDEYYSSVKINVTDTWKDKMGGATLPKDWATESSFSGDGDVADDDIHSAKGKIQRASYIYHKMKAWGDVTIDRDQAQEERDQNEGFLTRIWRQIYDWGKGSADYDDSSELYYVFTHTPTNKNASNTADTIDTNNNNPYYRYTYDWVPLIIELLGYVITHVLIVFKVIQLLYELIVIQLLGSLFAATDLVSGERSKKIITTALSTYAMLFILPILLLVYQLGLEAIYQAIRNMSIESNVVRGALEAVALFAWSAAAIDGPNIIQQLLGIDAGLRSAWKTMAGLYAAGKTATAIGKGAARAGANAIGAGAHVASKGINGGLNRLDARNSRVLGSGGSGGPGSNSSDVGNNDNSSTKALPEKDGNKKLDGNNAQEAIQEGERGNKHASSLSTNKAAGGEPSKPTGIGSTAGKVIGAAMAAPHKAKNFANEKAGEIANSKAGQVIGGIGAKVAGAANKAKSIANTANENAKTAARETISKMGAAEALGLVGGNGENNTNSSSAPTTNSTSTPQVDAQNANVNASGATGIDSSTGGAAQVSAGNAEVRAQNVSLNQEDTGGPSLSEGEDATSINSESTNTGAIEAGPAEGGSDNGSFTNDSSRESVGTIAPNKDNSEFNEIGGNTDESGYIHNQAKAVQENRLAEPTPNTIVDDVSKKTGYSYAETSNVNSYSIGRSQAQRNGLGTGAARVEGLAAVGKNTKAWTGRIGRTLKETHQANKVARNKYLSS